MKAAFFSCLLFGMLACRSSGEAATSIDAAPAPSASPPMNVASAVPAPADVVALRNGLLELEAHVRWRSVSGAWPAKRAKWLSDVNTSTTSAAMGARVLELESAMGWSAIQPTWRDRRPDWMKDIARARTNAAIADALMELETAIKWSALDDQWPSLRSAWLASLHAIKS